MKRREALLVAGSTVAALGGCSAAPLGSSTSTRPLPEKPRDLNEEAVVEYVREHAEVSRANRAIRRGADEIHVDCSAAVARRDGDGFYVATRCYGSSRSGEMHGHFGYFPFYYVDGDATIPIDPGIVRDVETYEVEGERLAESGDRRGIEIANFDDVDHVLSVSVTDVGRGRSDPIFEREFPVGKHGGVEPHPFVASSGTYAVDVALDGGTDQRFRWRVVEDPTWYGVWIAITPDGELFTCGTVEGDCATAYPVET